MRRGRSAIMPTVSSSGSSRACQTLAAMSVSDAVLGTKMRSQCSGFILQPGLTGALRGAEAGWWKDQAMGPGMPKSLAYMYQSYR